MSGLVFGLAAAVLLLWFGASASERTQDRVRIGWLVVIPLLLLVAIFA